MEECSICFIPIVSVHKCFLVIHYVLVWWLFEPKYLNMPKVRVFCFLNKVQLLFKVFSFFNWNVISHYLLFIEIDLQPNPTAYMMSQYILILIIYLCSSRLQTTRKIEDILPVKLLAANFILVSNSRLSLKFSHA